MAVTESAVSPQRRPGAGGPPLPWLKPGIFLGALAPLVSIALRAGQGELSANPIAEAENELGLAALVCPTLSGRSARLISAHRPTVPIYALSPGRETVRRCGLMWGVRAASIPRFEITEELIAASARRVVELGWCQPGHRVGITAGLPSGRPGTTSLLQIQEL